MKRLLQGPDVFYTTGLIAVKSHETRTAGDNAREIAMSQGEAPQHEHTEMYAHVSVLRLTSVFVTCRKLRFVKNLT